MEIRDGLLHSGFHRLVEHGQVLDIQELSERPVEGQEYFTVLVDRLVLICAVKSVFTTL